MALWLELQAAHLKLSWFFVVHLSLEWLPAQFGQTTFLLQDIDACPNLLQLKHRLGGRLYGEIGTETF